MDGTASIVVLTIDGFAESLIPTEWWKAKPKTPSSHSLRQRSRLRTRVCTSAYICVDSSFTRNRFQIRVTHTSVESIGAQKKFAPLTSPSVHALEPARSQNFDVKGVIRLTTSVLAYDLNPGPWEVLSLRPNRVQNGMPLERISSRRKSASPNKPP
ncbi:hypothetical protein DFH06DRAFT_1302479 [Mycena polygramma]|nr:hypothetical protein DFH06DRAFT_1302479 [Mycena polygramma]